MAGFDYSNYGAFKNAAGAPHFFTLARKLKIKNRYLRFLSGARLDLPAVEIGCGNGAFIKAMLDDGFENVRGVEPSGTYNVVVSPDLIHQGFAEPFFQVCPEGSLGLVVALDVFEHVPQVDLRELFVLIESRLVSGGLLVFRVPNMASPLALVNYFGDLSHTTALNEVSVQQLAFGSGLKVERICPEPFAFPRSFSALVGIVLWPLYRVMLRTAWAAFGIRTKILTPNLVCVLRKSEQ